MVVCGFFSVFVCLFSKGLPLLVFFKNFMFHYIESLESTIYSLHLGDHTFSVLISSL